MYGLPQKWRDPRISPVLPGDSFTFMLPPLQANISVLPITGFREILHELQTAAGTLEGPPRAPALLPRPLASSG